MRRKELDPLSRRDREIEALKAENRRLKQAIATESHEIEQRLGRALGYPRYCDDQKSFPGATDADGVCVGDHVAASLAAEAANVIAALRGEVETLKRNLETERELHAESRFCDARQREALTWAVGFIQCNYPDCEAYPDYHNAASLVLGGRAEHCGPFWMQGAQLERRTEQLRRLREAAAVFIAAARQFLTDSGNALATETDKARWLARFREAVEAFEKETAAK